MAGFVPALIAALVIGLLNATVGLFLKIITFPLSILTLGLFLLVINGVMILLASSRCARISRNRPGPGLLGRSGTGSVRNVDSSDCEGRVAAYCETAGCGVGADLPDVDLSRSSSCRRLLRGRGSWLPAAVPGGRFLPAGVARSLAPLLAP